MIDRATFVRSLAAVLAGPSLIAQSPRPFNMLVLGDSISWGQGLEHTSKWRYLLQKAIEAKLNRPVQPYAPRIHSGAIIGIGDRNEIGQPGLYQPGEREESFVDPPFPDPAFPERGGEIPSSTPTILAQLDTMDQPPQKDVVFDLVVVSAGINDVDITRFISPFQESKYIDWLIKQHCHFHLAALLDRIRARCIESNPSCRVVVLSYFPIISEESVNFPNIRDFVSALMRTPPRPTPKERRDTSRAENSASRTDQANATRGIDLQNKSLSEQPGIVKDMMKAAKTFYDTSQTAIDEAVNDANRVAPHSFMHVTPSIGPSEALFVPATNASRLWPVTFAANEDAQPHDQVYPDRIPLCTKIYAGKNKNMAENTCRIASIGHPNIAGAEFGYFAAIWAKLEPLIGK